ncbi:uncharacterized protein TOT_020000085 [Theileria orientalis strain Shintoku]|uniref:Peptidase C1A papain C-terminal domain-containing protein n=1 Tax=Theileria orientalis strain Shintoku TaxID=869250 RepID=J4DNZ4_THEOR|nr:uncharacterized protein TOT_020000085 [Theileria orientalis strain Shintoku]BAM39814.1 uncharacterized protein TOT_020000085 [Theileria orientalis strain Shintoku]|eukprot:XP_009690115.1 uncharacterized protein TOT_020000085 [Theileria orientalis strain Shintoku]
MKELDVERQIFQNETRKCRIKKCLSIGTLIVVIILVASIISTLIFFGVKGPKSKKYDKIIPLQLPLVERINVIEQPSVVIKADSPKDFEVPPPVVPKLHVDPDPDPKIVPEVKRILKANPVEVMKKESIMTHFVEIARNKKVEIIEGDFETCAAGNCGTHDGEFVHEWKLKAVSEDLKVQSPTELEDEFDKIIKYDRHNLQYGKYYSDVLTYNQTFKIFKKNIEIVETHNKNPKRLYDMKLNMFAAYAEDFGDMTYYPIKNPLFTVPKTAGVIEDFDQVIDVDWRKKDAVTDVIAQGGCGSCWAIAATDMFNSFMMIKKGSQFEMSYQQVLDCTDRSFTCQRGGNHGKALEYIKKNKICLNSEKEYKGHMDTCDVRDCKLSSEIEKIKRMNHDESLEYLKEKGPFLTSFETNTSFLLYDDGIYDGSCENGRGHSIVVVGHGHDTKKKVDYWIVKNSWGKDWGEDGYFRIIDSSKMDGNVKRYHCDFTLQSYGWIRSKSKNGKNNEY